MINNQSLEYEGEEPSLCINQSPPDSSTENLCFQGMMYMLHKGTTIPWNPYMSTVSVLLNLLKYYNVLIKK